MHKNKKAQINEKLVDFISKPVDYVVLEKTALLQTLDCGLASGVCKCAVLWAGFLFSLCGGRKNKINFPQTAPPYQRSTNPVNPFFENISIKFQCVVSVSYTCLRTAINTGGQFTHTIFIDARTLKLPKIFQKNYLLPAWIYSMLANVVHSSDLLLFQTYIIFH